MKAVQVQKSGGPEVLTLVDLPALRPKPNEAIVKVSAAGVNFIDVHIREGLYPSTLPFIIGQEASGIVSEIGADVKSFKPGDRVAYTGIRGSYAEYAAVPADRLVLLPPGISEQHAAAGGVGLLLVQMAKNIGARVIATAGTEEKAKLARAAGADEVILYAQQDFEVETKRLTDGKGVHVVYDGVGKTTFDKDLEVFHPRGYLVLFGASSGPVPPFDLAKLAQKGSLFVTRPTIVHYIAAHEELQKRATDVLTMIATGKIKLRIEHIYPLKEAQQAHRDLEGRKTTGKLLLIP